MMEENTQQQLQQELLQFQRQRRPPLQPRQLLRLRQERREESDGESSDKNDIDDEGELGSEYEDQFRDSDQEHGEQDINNQSPLYQRNQVPILREIHNFDSEPELEHDEEFEDEDDEDEEPIENHDGRCNTNNLQESVPLDDDEDEVEMIGFSMRHDDKLSNAASSPLVLPQRHCRTHNLNVKRRSHTLSPRSASPRRYSLSPAISSPLSSSPSASPLLSPAIPSTPPSSPAVHISVSSASESGSLDQQAQQQSTNQTYRCSSPLPSAKKQEELWASLEREVNNLYLSQKKKNKVVSKDEQQQPENKNEHQITENPEIVKLT